MECPNCKKDTANIVHTDPIECFDCGSINKIEYCSCPECNYSFRLNNGKIIDGSVINYEMLDEAFEEIMDAVDQGIMDTGTMSDLLYKCIRCGSSTAYKSNDFEYRCPECGMEWEILGYE